MLLPTLLLFIANISASLASLESLLVTLPVVDVLVTFFHAVLYLLLLITFYIYFISLFVYLYVWCFTRSSALQGLDI